MRRNPSSEPADVVDINDLATRIMDTTEPTEVMELAGLMEASVANRADAATAISAFALAISRILVRDAPFASAVEGGHPRIGLAASMVILGRHEAALAEGFDISATPRQALAFNPAQGNA